MEEQVEDACAWSELVVHEDLGACEGVQANLEAGAYTDGPLSPLQEAHVARFQSLVRGALEDCACVLPGFMAPR